MKTLPLFALISFFALSVAGAAEEKSEAKVDSLEAEIVVKLQERVGQNVELRLRSGEKLAGKIEKTTSDVVHLTQLTGMELFEAFVRIDDVTAIVVRAKSK